MSRFVLYCATLFVLAGPTWLGQVGVAEAGYRPMGISLASPGLTAAEDGSDSAGALDLVPPGDPIPDENPHAKPSAHFGEQPNSGGASAPTGASAGSSAAPAVAVLTTAAEVGTQVVTRLRVVRDWFPPDYRLSSVFEPPRSAL